MYHDIVAAGDEDTTGFPGRDAALYKISPDAFAAHLDAIASLCATPPARPSCPSRPRPHLRRWRQECDEGGGDARSARMDRVSS